MRAILDNLEELLCAVLLVIMVGVTIVNVIARWVPGVSFASSEELVVNLFVWLTMLGAIIAVKHNAHISITLITKRIPARYRTCLFLIQWFSVSLLLFLLLLYGAVETWSEYRAGMMTYSLGWPLWFFTLSLPVGSLLFLIRFSQTSIRHLKGLK